MPRCRSAADCRRVEKLAGTMRYSAGQLRGLALEGNWLGGPGRNRIASRGARGALAFADEWRCRRRAAARVVRQGGCRAARQRPVRVEWLGAAQSPTDDLWQISLSSNLGGLESRLPEPFDKARARARAGERRICASRAMAFAISWSRAVAALEMRGQRPGAASPPRTSTCRAWPENCGASRADGTTSELRLDELDARARAAVLAVAAALLPADGRTGGDASATLRYGDAQPRAVAGVDRAR